MARDYDSIVTEVASKLRLDTSIAAQQTLVQGWVNDVIEDIHGRHDWFWTLERYPVQTVIDKTAGTVAVSASGTTVTGTSTAFGSSDVGSFIQFQDSNDWYKITAVASATSLTIEVGYNGTSALTAATYTLRKFFYSMPSNAEKILSAKQAPTWRDLVCINHKDFDTYLTFGDNTGKARVFCVYGLDSSNNIQFNIYPHADAAYNIEVKYKKKATESSVSVIPAKWLHVYLDGALYRGMEYVAMGSSEFKHENIDRKKRDYELGIARMLQDAEPESDYTCVLMNRDLPNSLPVPRLPDSLSIPLDD